MTDVPDYPLFFDGHRKNKKYFFAIHPELSALLTLFVVSGSSPTGVGLPGRWIQVSSILQDGFYPGFLTWFFSS
jgi:hypothetical protein